MSVIERRPSTAKTCNGTRKDGEPCQSTAVDANGFCFAHGRSPMQVAENARKAAAVSAQVRREAAKSPRDRMREEMEAKFNAVWSVFEEAWNANTPEGEPDHRVRLASVKEAMDQAFGKPAQALTGEGGGPIEVRHQLIVEAVEKLTADVGIVRGELDPGE